MVLWREWPVCARERKRDYCLPNVRLVPKSDLDCYGTQVAVTLKVPALHSRGEPNKMGGAHEAFDVRYGSMLLIKSAMEGTRLPIGAC